MQTETELFTLLLTPKEHIFCVIIFLFGWELNNLLINNVSVQTNIWTNIYLIHVTLCIYMEYNSFKL